MNMCTLLEVSMTEVRKEILKGIRECAERGLIQTTKWLSELNFSLKHIKVEDEPMALNYNSTACDEQDSYMLAKSYFDCQEYDRAAHFLENCVTPKCTFLHRYSQYMSSEKKRLDNLNDNGNDISDTNQAQVLLDLLSYYKTNRNNLDGYGLYLYGVVLNKLDLRTQALDVLQEAVNAAPWLWSAWVELSTLISSMEMMESLQLPRHWMLYFFIGHTFVELKLTEQALETYDRLQNVGFGTSNYVNAQLAVVHHDRRDVETSLNLFRELFQADPYRLENWDVYSHLLYVKEKKMELANLAQRAISIDKYRVETCCVIGNYYSLRNEYEKAVVYFQRALSLDPQYLTAWILMGHEFVELQNSNAAIQCYRQAIDVNRNDYRAWNGLGQAYEILGLNGYCVYYYARAAQLRPYDSRMLVSLGQAYEKMDKIPNALKCYHRAHSTGDIEGMALFKLAKLYEKLSMSNSAAAAFTAACQGATTQNKELPSAYRYLTYYHLKLGLLDYAAHYAYKCLEYAETKEEGKALLKTISEKRASTAQSSKGGLDCSPAEEEPPLSQSMFATPLTNAPPPANVANTSSGSPSSLVRKRDARYKM